MYQHRDDGFCSDPHCPACRQAFDSSPPNHGQSAKPHKFQSVYRDESPIASLDDRVKAIEEKTTWTAQELSWIMALIVASVALIATLVVLFHRCTDHW